MHSAPAVSYPVGRSSMRALIYIVPALLACLACGAWAWQSAAADVVRLPVLLLCGLVLVLAGWAALQPPQGQLVWDGQSWRWETATGAQVGRVHARLDGQEYLLLEFRPMQGRGIWLWLARGMAPRVWDELRRAVYDVSAEEASMPGGAS
ncbi:MAG: hypothetical protein O9318_01135 [Hylemonella sp.]|uniref:hypothetical protein n=1 Tax=Hylemonella sp. TaxID=2066020 RepID=UPI0022CCA452|nr:hypothetical protein [Hylemonella sp.]MCZ8251053.1 hypothetical protein [Hylemonella sp.]